MAFVFHFTPKTLEKIVNFLSTILRKIVDIAPRI
jgi:hypothetical protein